MRLIIPGTPIAKKRPRFVKKTGHAYNDQQTEEGKFLLMCINEITEKFDCAIRMEFEFIFARPKSHFGTGRNASVLKQSAPMHHLSVPDVDNLQKFCCDALNNVAYKDDSQIIEKHGKKRYADHEMEEEAHTVLIIEKV